MNEKNQSKLLITFCNVMPRGLVFGVYDFDSEKFHWIDLGEKNKFLHGSTGILLDKNKLWLLTQIDTHNKSGLLSLDENYDIEQSYILENTKDAHDLISFEGGFLVIDTAHNKINKISFLGNKINETNFWTYNNDDSDTVHVNSIAKIHEKIFVSLFGLQPSNGWAEAHSGQIIEITTNKIISENLRHPHSLINIDNSLYCLESNTGKIYRFNDNYSPETIVNLQGYIRGVSFDDNFFYVGASARRRKSRSKGTQNTNISEDDEQAHSVIYRINRNTLEIEKKDMTFFGLEIFGLLTMKQIPKFITTNPILQRFQKYDDEILEFDNRLKNYLLDFETTLKEKDHYLETTLKEKDHYLETTLKEKDRYVQKIVEDYQNQIKEIKQSKLWKFLKIWDKIKRN